jgi:hypothetical protein
MRRARLLLLGHERGGRGASRVGGLVLGARVVSFWILRRDGAIPLCWHEAVELLSELMC